MQHAERCRTQAIERSRAIEVADDGYDAVEAQPGGFVAAARETVEPRAPGKQRRGAQRDVAATNQQNPDHHPRAAR